MICIFQELAKPVPETPVLRQELLAMGTPANGLLVRTANVIQPITTHIEKDTKLPLIRLKISLHASLIPDPLQMVSAVYLWIASNRS